jgi:carotenoid cleavage dioxygenase
MRRPTRNIIGSLATGWCMHSTSPTVASRIAIAGVRTPKWELEQAAGRALFGSWGNPRTTDPIALDKDDGVANTNIVWHAGRLLALEEAHLPFEVDPRSLESRGYCDFSGALKSQVTAHPKIDPLTGELVFFGYSIAGPFTPAMGYGAVDACGALTRFERFEAPFASMVHDFMVTREHVLFPILPLTGSMERARAGLPPYAWEPACGAQVGVMCRDGSVAAMHWFTGEPCYMFHALNAWEEGDRIVAYVMQSEAAPLFPLPDGTPGDPKKHPRGSAAGRSTLRATAIRSNRNTSTT